jgi:hypothetical protein
MVVLDSHVHIHPVYDLTTFLCAASRNMAAMAARAGGTTTQVLCLTESQGTDMFQELHRGAEREPLRAGTPWTFRAVDELTLAATGPGGAELILIAGRQVVSRDNLEVLAVGTRESFTDRTATTRDTIAAVSKSGAIAILPWGAGKWLSRRGQVVNEAILSDPSEHLFLGDSSGRPIGSRPPGQFALAASRGVRVLRGSDPLPFRREQTRAGRFGDLVQVDLDQDYSTPVLLQALRDPDIRIDPCGRADGLSRYLVNQCAMQLRKRLGGG